MIRRHYYFSLNNNGINYIKNKLGITEQKVQPRTRALRAEALEPDQEERPRRDRGERGDRPGGFRGRGAPRGAGFRAPRDNAPAAEDNAAPRTEQAPATEAM